MDQRVRVVPGLDQLALLLVLVLEALGLLGHALDVGIGQAARSLDADRLLLARGLVPGRHVDDAVGVDVEGHLDLRHAARGRRYADEVELAEQLVVLRHLALALGDADRHRALAILGGGEHLALLGRDGGVALDQAREHAAERLDAERERRHVEQQHVLDVALEHAGLDRRADGHHLVGVDALVRLLAEQLLDDLLHLRHARHAADQHHLADVRGLEAGVLQRLNARALGLLDQVVDQALELGARELHGQMQRRLRLRVHRDERQVDLGLLRGGELDLGLLGGFLEPLQGELVAPQIDLVLLLELAGQILDQAHVEVLAAEEGVAVGRLHLEHAVADLQNGDVEGATAEVVDGDGLGILLLVEAVGERGRGRLIDDAQHFQAGDLAGVLGGLALGVVEVGGNGDHRFLDGLAELGLGRLLHLLQDEGGDLRRRVLLALRLDPGIPVGALDDLVGNELLVLLHHRVVVAPADQALDGKESIGRIGYPLALGRQADETFPIAGKGYDRGGGIGAFGVLENVGLSALHHRDARVGGAEVDPNNFGHALYVLFLRQTVRTQ